MKKLLYITIISLVVSSCDVFDVAPEASISDADAITNASGLNAALAGLYAQMQGSYYSGDLFFLADVSSDIAQSVGTWDFYREMDTYVVNADNTEIQDLWGAIYQTVNQANNIIEAAPNVGDANQDVRDNAQGEAYFARALAFFDAARIWGGIPNAYNEGGIPLPLEPAREASFPSRASIGETYNQIEADLMQALSLLPETVNRGRATKDAARGLLARYYLYVEDYAQASNYASQLIAKTSSYDLLDDYTGIFSGKNTMESIFELQFDNVNQSDVRFWYAPGAIGGRGELAAHDDFFNSIDDADERKQLFDFDAVGGFTYPTKYIKAGDIDNTHVLRIAEMYLIRAEADFLRGAGDPLADINAIRNRSGLGDLDTVTLDAILDERKIELAFEGHRWFDLLRTGKAIDALSSVPRSNTPGDPAQLMDQARQLFPFPNTELNVNANLVQNNAYK
ncbi:MAG: RagB/SusD family nutrient uptake outer membrane protein [Saprospiraceae bacterium]